MIAAGADVRFVVDETALRLDGLEPSRVNAVIEEFLERVRVARNRKETLWKFSELDSAAIDETRRLSNLLYESGSWVGYDHDAIKELMLSLDRCPIWDERFDLVDPTVTMAGEPIFAASIAFCASRAAASLATACLPFTSAGRRGPIMVALASGTVPVHFVTTEADHRAFFRAAISLEADDAETYQALTPSAFPDLLWADGLWKGLKDLSKPFHQIKEALTTHLSVLDLDAPAVFREFLATRPEEIGPRLQAFGAPASDENGKTKKNKKARADRCVTYGGEEVVCWWHTKIEPDRDRIHFFYNAEDDTVLIGVFHRHLYLPA